MSGMQRPEKRDQARDERHKRNGKGAECQEWERKQRNEALPRALAIKHWCMQSSLKYDVNPALT